MHDAPCFESVTAVTPAADAVLPRPRRRRWLRPLLDTFGRAALLCIVVQLWVAQGYKVFGSCMEPNLYTGERLLGSKLALIQGIHRGDVVIFQPPHRNDTAYIKRIIALPGDLFEIRHSRVYVNNRPLNEPYLRRTWHDDRAPERIPPNMVFVMGDNRDHSNDSRAWGELPLDHIQAKAWMRYWPLDRMGLIQ